MQNLTNSEIGCYRTCARKWYYQYELGREKHQTSEPLYFGSAVGIGLDAIWNGQGNITEGFEAYLDKHGENDKKHVLYYKGLAMLSGYRKYWDLDEWELVSTELSVELELNEFVTLLGRADKLARNKKDGVLYIIDHKTSGDDVQNSNSDYWLLKMFDPQLTGYKAAVEAKYGEEVRIMYDVIRKHSSQGPKQKTPAVRKRKAEADEEFALRKADNVESWQEYADRVYLDYIEKPEEYYQQRVIGRTASDLETWRAEFVANAASIANARVVGTYPRNVGGCRSYNTLCSYASVCCGLDSIESNNFMDKSSRHPELEEDHVTV